jgi:hypothetical protein
MASWHDETSAQDEWPDAPVDEDGGTSRLSTILEAAKDAVLSYAPEQEVVPVDIPAGWREAQLKQAQNIWNASKASPSGDFDGGQYGLSTFPLDWSVRQLIRPKRGRPVIG